MATIRDVAKIANVSPTTVSATLSGSAPVSEELKERVWAAVKQANYRPDPMAQNLRRGVSTTIGFIVPDIAAPWASHLAKSIQHALSNRGFNMLLASNEDDPEREFRDIALMISHRVAGLVIAPTSLGATYAERLEATISCPAVLVDRVVAPERFDAVTDDNELGGKLLAEYLLKLGHRRVAILVGRAGISASYERYEAVSAAFAASGHPLRESYIRHAIHTVDGAYAEVQELMSMADPPTAIICISNTQIRGTMGGLKNMGLDVPEDVSVISFDGFNPAEGWKPMITCLIQDTDAISNTAVDTLLARIGGADSRGQRFRIKPRLRIGDSCTPPRR